MGYSFRVAAGFFYIAAGFLLLSEWFFTICQMPVELTESVRVELCPVKAVLMGPLYSSYGGSSEPFVIPANWCNKGCGMCYPVCGMVHIKEPLWQRVFSCYLSGPSPHVQ